MDQKYDKILILGMEGMDYTVTRALMAAEKLPNFLKLAKKGSMLRLDTCNPNISPVPWVSISTGMNPGKHNIFDFIRRNQQTYAPSLSLVEHNEMGYKSFVKAKPFWKIVSDANIHSTIIRWPATFPSEKINGKMLAGFGVPDVRGFLNGYTYYTEEKNGQDKNILVTNNQGEIITYLNGPRETNNIVTSSMNIKIIDEKTTLIVDQEEYQLKKGEWSDWIKVSFQLETREVNGIFKAYLINTNPFKLYITTIHVNPENTSLDISYPASFSKELADDLGLYYTLGTPEEIEGYIDNKIDKEALLQQVKDVEEQREKMFWKEFHEFNNKTKALLGFVFDTSDKLQHVFWNQKVLDKKDEKLTLNKVVVDYYERKDKLLEKILEKTDDKTLLLIISDHGITSFEKAFNLNTWLAKEGYICLTKELNHEKGELFNYVDWDITRAYSLGFSSLYINLKGREGQGTVNNKELIIKELISKLEDLTDPETGGNVINKVYRRQEIYSGEYTDAAPDLIIGFNPGYRMSWDNAIGGFGEEVLEKNESKWNGDNLVDPKFVPGILFSNLKIDGKFAHQYDVAPTILDALGIEIPDNMDGRSLIKK